MIPDDLDPDSGPWHPAPAWVEPALWGASLAVWGLVVWLIL